MVNFVLFLFPDYLISLVYKKPTFFFKKVYRNLKYILLIRNVKLVSVFKVTKPHLFEVSISSYLLGKSDP